MKKKYIVSLTKKDKDYLVGLTKRGRHPARVITRARILLLASSGLVDLAISQRLSCSRDTVRAVRKRACRRPTITAAVHDAPRPGQPAKLQPQHEAFLVATACTPAPSGHDHWTLTALREALTKTYRAVRVTSLNPIRAVLLRHRLQPWREKNVVPAQPQAAV